MIDLSSNSTTESSARFSDSNKSITAPLLMWLVLQLLALTLAAARIPLSANFARPGESLAIQEMLIVQFAASALLFPFLLRDIRCLLALVISAAPMLQLAAMLSGAPTGGVIGAWTCVSIWLIGLSLWRASLSSRSHPVAVAVTGLISLGGLVLYYVGIEFHSAPSFARFLPLVATLRFTTGDDVIFLPLLSTGVFTLAGVISLTSKRFTVNCA